MWPGVSWGILGCPGVIRLRPASVIVDIIDLTKIPVCLYGLKALYRNTVKFFFKPHLLNHWSKFKITSHDALYKIAQIMQMVYAPLKNGWQSSR